MEGSIYAVLVPFFYGPFNGPLLTLLLRLKVFIFVFFFLFSKFPAGSYDLVHIADSYIDSVKIICQSNEPNNFFLRVSFDFRWWFKLIIVCWIVIRKVIFFLYCDWNEYCWSCGDTLSKEIHLYRTTIGMMFRQSLFFLPSWRMIWKW